MITDATSFALLEGSRSPQTDQERYYLTFMGGVRGPRETWPTKWCVCHGCEVEWKASASFPSPTGHWVYPRWCPECRKKYAQEREWPAKKAGKQKASERKDLWN